MGKIEVFGVSIEQKSSLHLYGFVVNTSYNLIEVFVVDVGQVVQLSAAFAHGDLHKVLFEVDADVVELAVDRLDVDVSSPVTNHWRMQPQATFS